MLQEQPAGERNGSLSRDELRVWHPLFTQKKDPLAFEVLHSIADALVDAATSDRTLANGSAGIALFHAYMNSAHPKPQWREAAVRRLREATDQVTWDERWDAFGTGALGIAWTAAHLRRLIPNLDCDFELELQQRLSQRLGERPWRGVYDMTDGLAGYALYALESGDRHAGRETLLARVIDRLEEVALPLAGGLAWWNAPHNMDAERRRNYPLGLHNLGVPHGIPGTIAIVSQVCLIPDARKKAERLLNGAVRWLLSQRKRATHGSCFNSVIAFGDNPSETHSSPLAWCYGDLGLSTALYWAAVTVEREDWKEAALDVARRAASRAWSAECTKEPGLCHGAAGIAHMFNRLYQATREEAFLQAARTWFAFTLSFYDRTAGSSHGIRFPDEYRDAEGNALDAQAGLFGGVGGIGLALLAATHPAPPEWDRVMCTAIPPVGFDADTVATEQATAPG